MAVRLKEQVMCGRDEKVGLADDAKVHTGGVGAEDIINSALLEMGLIDDLSKLSDEDTTSIFLAVCNAFIKRNK